MLPEDVSNAARTNDIRTVLDWLGPPPVDTRRINAKNSDYLDLTLVHCAVLNNNSDLLSILLQLGADVDPLDVNGFTALFMCAAKSEYIAPARLLLEWGAEISNCGMASKDEFIEGIIQRGNSKLANLIGSEFGGRRCEIINMPNQPDLIDKTCVVKLSAGQRKVQSYIRNIKRSWACRPR